MLAYDIKEILTIVPEALPMVKKANLEADFPVDSKDSAVASYLRMQYMMKVAHKTVPYDAIELLEKAAGLYGFAEEVKPLVAKMEAYEQHVKVASMTKVEEDLRYKELEIEGNLTGFTDLEKVASEAQSLYDSYEVQSDIVKLYACDAYLNKEAALGALAARYQATEDANFMKVASVLRKIDSDSLSIEELRLLCNTVTHLDKQAQISTKGFNFFKEALIKKAAMVSVCKVHLAGVDVPYENIEKLGKDRIAQILGKDVADELTGDPRHNKQVLETLPLDLQQMLSKFARPV